MAEQKESELGPDYLDKDWPELEGLKLVSLTMWHSYNSKGCTVTHTHRWYVNGFWRRLRKGTQYEHHVYVRPHLRGPAGMPIKGL